ncbi:hypothetical protein NPS01_32580 [Nocardioides psychrotolerans]|uniref:Uncharacterized protein n=1 Tax=Nocardioides psychrotolerans TaxID=1005945 RepID=A0A1I3NWJ7_9ACTN|nr:hypothetical protein [Nocardioides psychrotolerans]GEP39595.1 hypothetical protein NPS01_32580 [Nocardioides psychrotolerans]SFJ13654.1 hypothetical protein SAMN05216561_11915 [Nocardioides psychrotolerans]
MILILTLLAAFPLGYLMKTRTTPYLVFGLAFAHLFTFQTASLGSPDIATHAAVVRQQTSRRRSEDP